MAREHQTFKNVNLPSLKVSICVALVWYAILQFHHVSGIQCGPDGYDEVDVIMNARMMGVDETNRGQWPFIAALYLINQSKYFCGGTLISNRHILTAAHCIQGKGSSQRLSYGDIEVRLGAYNLTVKCEKGVVLRNVSEIFVHPDWNVYNDDYDADLAILVLKDKVTFTENIQRISLPADEHNILEEIPRQVDIVAFNVTHCFLKLKVEGTLALSSLRTFCAPSIGDSGGGFFVNIDDTWRQYGIISSIRTDSNGFVVRTLVAIYTNVQAFRSWIKNTTMEMKISKTVNLHCTYRYLYLNFGHGCYVQETDFGTEDIYVASITGSQVIGRTNEDVEMIYFNGGTMLSVPSGLEERFQNLKHLYLESCLTTKLITRSNMQFENLEKLTELYFYSNKIEQLMFDLLWDVPVLETFSFVKNELKLLDERIFEKNTRLKIVYLKDNLLEFLPRNLFKNNFLLEKVDLSENSLKNIEIDFTSLRNVNRIDLFKNTCIDIFYSEKVIRFLDPLKRVTNLSEFQRKIRINCTSING